MPDQPQVVAGRMNAEVVIARLEAAGQALLALPNTGPSTRLVQSGLEWMRDAAETNLQAKAKLRPAIPTAAEITLMDQALGWIPLIPPDKYVLRRIVGARSLVSPLSGRHLFTWRRLGIAIGCDHKAVQRWHGQGVDIIVAALRQAARHPAASGVQGQRSLAKPPAHHGGTHA